MQVFNDTMYRNIWYFVFGSDLSPFISSELTGKKKTYNRIIISQTLKFNFVLSCASKHNNDYQTK